MRDSVKGLPADAIVDLKGFRTTKITIAEISALTILPKWRGKIFFPLMKFLYELSYNELPFRLGYFLSGRNFIIISLPIIYQCVRCT
jgi:hypothetical protein